MVFGCQTNVKKIPVTVTLLGAEDKFAIAHVKFLQDIAYQKLLDLVHL